MIETLLSLAFIGQMLRITVPYALAAVGGSVSERAGVINISLEGTMLLGAFSAALGAYYADSALAGAGAAVVGGVAVGAVYAVVVIRFRADQIVAGVAINLLAVGLTRFLLKRAFDSTANSPPVAGLDAVVVAEPLFWAACLLVVAAHYLVTRTVYGLRLRAVGDHPDAAASVGVSVAGVRWRAVVLAGALAGLGGGWLALASEGFTADMSNGRGYVALAAVIMGKWRPAAATWACLLFGFAEALKVNLQATTALAIPNELIQIVPYVLTMVALAGFIGRSRPPKALGKPY
jgi:general nucleoside transport system permease protein